MHRTHKLPGRVFSDCAYNYCYTFSSTPSLPLPPLQPLRMALSLAETTGSDFNKIPNTYHLLIQTLLSQPSRIHEAHTLVDQALSHDPRHPQLHTDKCLILHRLNKTREAVQWCQETLNINPSDPRIHYQLGVAYLRLGHSDKAERAFRDLLALQPNNTHGLFHLATVCHKTGRLEEAAKL